MLGDAALLTDLALVRVAAMRTAPSRTSYQLLAYRSRTGHTGALLLALEPEEDAP